MSMAALPDDLVDQILFRLPSDDPWCFARASLVCKLWRDLISHPTFLRRRAQALRRAAPLLLGFLLDEDDREYRVDERALAFFPTSAFSLPIPDGGPWSPSDCRHGRVLFCSAGQGDTEEFLVWEPVTDKQWVVPIPAAQDHRIHRPHRYPNAAVVCAAEGCDHRNCLGGPFRVVVLFPQERPGDDLITWACVYSSETGAWGKLSAVPNICSYYAESSVLVGSSTLYSFSNYGDIFEYNLSTQSLALIYPPQDKDQLWRAVSNHGMVLMVAEDGGLGIAEADEWLLCLWSSKVNDAGVAEWVCYREIRLSIGSSLPKAALSGWGPIMMGFAEEAITIFMSTSAGIYIIDLKSGRVKKVCDHEFSFKILVPIVSSGHTLPAPRCEYQYPPSPTSSEEEEADSYPVKEEEVVEKALERSHELFVKGRMAIEQPDFVNGIDCLSHALEIRAARDGEHTPGCALLYKAQEEAVKSATSKAFAGNPKASGSTVECAPSLEQAGTEEGQNSNGIAQEDRKDDGDKYHDEMGGDENDSDLNLSWKMLNIARTIVEKSLGNTMGCVVSAPGEAASDAEGSSKSFQEDEIELRTGILAELNKLEDLEQAMTTPNGRIKRQL
ncbi:hypothetical protein BRADI_1g70307v3 [Brachypodium distachyon]|uniref:F-box domain-containing protein n=1 Tax=Brachypodium distachyon TaxID=15368 RepID=A0A2K2DUF8_BRADI|nr:hypothetical protein BRADI_1g70307v3 [Brachypodium distachyon]